MTTPPTPIRTAPTKVPARSWPAHALMTQGHRERKWIINRFTFKTPAVLLAFVAALLSAVVGVVVAEADHGVGLCSNHGEAADPWECQPRGNPPSLLWIGGYTHTWKDSCKHFNYRLGDKVTCIVGTASPKWPRAGMKEQSAQIDDDPTLSWYAGFDRREIVVSSDSYGRKTFRYTAYWHQSSIEGARSAHSLSQDIRVEFVAPATATVHGEPRCTIDGLTAKCRLPHYVVCSLGGFEWFGRHVRREEDGSQWATFSTRTPDVEHHETIQGRCFSRNPNRIYGYHSQPLIIRYRDNPQPAPQPNPQPEPAATPSPAPVQPAAPQPTETAADRDLERIITLQAQVNTLTKERDDARALLAQRNDELAAERRRVRDLERQLDAIPAEVEVRVALLGDLWWTGRWYLYSLDGGQWRQRDSFVLTDCIPGDPRTDCPTISVPTGKPSAR